MFEAIKDYCTFHKCSMVINYQASTGVWAVRLNDGDKCTGQHHAEDLSTAFNEAKKEYEDEQDKRI